MLIPYGSRARPSGSPPRQHQVRGPLPRRAVGLFATAVLGQEFARPRPATVTVGASGRSSALLGAFCLTRTRTRGGCCSVLDGHDAGSGKSDGGINWVPCRWARGAVLSAAFQQATPGGGFFSITSSTPQHVRFAVVSALAMSREGCSGCGDTDEAEEVVSSPRRREPTRGSVERASHAARHEGAPSCARSPPYSVRVSSISPAGRGRDGSLETYRAISPESLCRCQSPHRRVPRACDSRPWRLKYSRRALRRYPRGRAARCQGTAVRPRARSSKSRLDPLTVDEVRGFTPVATRSRSGTGRIRAASPRRASREAATARRPQV